MAHNFPLDKLQSFLADGPVLVVGPGCQRVSYDQSNDWKEVVRRFRLLAAVLPAESEEPTTPRAAGHRNPLRVFLDAFWRGGLITCSDDIFAPSGSKRSTADAARTALAQNLLVVLSASTECLGHVIASGEAPVRLWQDVRFQRDSPALTADVRNAASQALTRAEGALATFTQLSGELADWLVEQQQQSTDETKARAILKAAGSEIDEQPDPTLAAALQVMRVPAIAAHAEKLQEGYFTAPVTMPVSGATIEWLSDLLWHLMISGSKVPPSRAGVAFYLNLVDKPELSERLFTRSSPGEYRGDSSSLTDELYGLLTTYDSGLEESSPSPDGRRELFRVLAATMVENWEQAKAQGHEYPKASAPDMPTAAARAPSDDAPHPDERPGHVDNYAVALVEVYDLMLERQLVEVCDTGARFHTVVPVWVGPNAKSHHLRWLWGTYTKIHDYWSPDDLTGPAEGSGLTLKWQWSDDLAFSDVSGPIIVKVNGSPLLKLGKGLPTVRSLGLMAGPFPGSDQVRLATIFSEYDAVTSMLGFTEAMDKEADKNRVLPRRLTDTALSWKKRQWLFLGDSFPEWLSRLRIAYRANPRAVNPSHKLAIDRAFDWPELALLKTLDVEPWVGDLSRVSSYAQPQNRNGSRNAAFLEAVHARCAGGRR